MIDNGRTHFVGDDCPGGHREGTAPTCDFTVRSRQHKTKTKAEKPVVLCGKPATHVMHPERAYPPPWNLCEEHARMSWGSPGPVSLQHVLDEASARVKAKPDYLLSPDVREQLDKLKQERIDNGEPVPSAIDEKLEAHAHQLDQEARRVGILRSVEATRAAGLFRQAAAVLRGAK